MKNVVMIPTTYNIMWCKYKLQQKKMKNVVKMNRMLLTIISIIALIELVR